MTDAILKRLGGSKQGVFKRGATPPYLKKGGGREKIDIDR
jgi:hypothetical protein